MTSALTIYAVCVVVLFFKMFALSCYQGVVRIRHTAFVNREDAAVFGQVAQETERPEVIRAGKAWANDLENIPAFFALAGLAVALDASAPITAGLSCLFTLARTLHTLAYLKGIQPWRTVFYGVGVVCLLGLCVIITMMVMMA